MTRTLDIAERSQHTLADDELFWLKVRRAEREVESFVAELRKMAPDERISASEYTMSRWEYWIYAARFPNEVPIVNGELKRIVRTLE